MSSFAFRTGATATLVPALRRRSSRPPSASSRSARLTVARAQPNSLASSCSLGISVPGGQIRSLMRRITSCRTVCQGCVAGIVMGSGSGQPGTVLTG